MSIHVKLPNGERIVVSGCFTKSGYTVNVVLRRAASISVWFVKTDDNSKYSAMDAGEMVNQLVTRITLPATLNKAERKQAMRNIAHIWEIKILGEMT